MHGALKPLSLLGILLLLMDLYNLENVWLADLSEKGLVSSFLPFAVYFPIQIHQIHDGISDLLF